MCSRAKCEVKDRFNPLNSHCPFPETLVKFWTHWSCRNTPLATNSTGCCLTVASDSSPVCCLGFQLPITEDRLVLRGISWCFLITSSSKSLHARSQMNLKLLHCVLALITVAEEVTGLISFDRAVGSVVQVWGKRMMLVWLLVFTVWIQPKRGITVLIWLCKEKRRSLRNIKKEERMSSNHQIQLRWWWSVSQHRWYHWTSCSWTGRIWLTW